MRSRIMGEQRAGSTRNRRARTHTTQDYGGAEDRAAGPRRTGTESAAPCRLSEANGDGMRDRSVVEPERAKGAGDIRKQAAVEGPRRDTARTRQPHTPGRRKIRRSRRKRRW